MVTPEMLLFLAEKMGLQKPHIADDGFVMHFDGLDCDWPFAPHLDFDQFGRLVAMCPSHGVSLLITDGYTCASGTNHESPRMEHDDTPDSIRAAAVVAVCRALGWEEADNVPER